MLVGTVCEGVNGITAWLLPHRFYETPIAFLLQTTNDLMQRKETSLTWAAVLKHRPGKEGRVLGPGLLGWLP